MPTLKKYAWVYWLPAAVLGTALVLFVIRHGVGATGDAVWYMQGAENILKGYGYGILRGDGFLPTTLYPPFYSIVLAGLGLTGIPIFTLAGFLNALLFGVNIFLAGWIVYRLAGSAAAALLASAFTLLSIDLFKLHTWAMSEPLYLTLTLLGFLFILQYQDRGQPSRLALAGLAAGLSVATRYIGIALVAALCLWTLAFGQGNTKKRLGEAALLAGLGLLPVAIFFMRNLALGGAFSGRSAMLLRAIPKENYLNLALTITSWFLPGIAYRLSTHLLAAVFAGLAVLSAALFTVSVRHLPGAEEGANRRQVRFEVLALAFLFFYVLTFLASISLSLAGNPILWTDTQISRYVTPVFPVFIILDAMVFLRLLRRLSAKGRVFSPAMTAAACFFLALYLYTFAGLRSKPIYLGYTEIRNDYPALVAELKSIAPPRAIVASNYELGYFLSGRPVYSMPGEGDELTGAPNPDLPRLQQKMVDLIDQGAVFLVYRSSPDETFYYDPVLNEMVLLNSYPYGNGSIALYTGPGQGH